MGVDCCWRPAGEGAVFAWGHSRQNGALLSGGHWLGSPGTPGGGVVTRPHQLTTSACHAQDLHEHLLEKEAEIDFGQRAMLPKV